MQYVRLIVDNEFVKSGRTNLELEITVFDRVFRKLTNQGGPIGKVQPVYLISGANSKTLGVLTSNNGGSFSFFPELPGDYDFDHMTFNRDLQKGNHHYTRVSEQGRQKVLPIYADLLSNKMYHAATFVFQNLELLKVVPQKIIYPLVGIDRLKEINEAFITVGQPGGSILLPLDDGQGALCMQIFLIPNAVDYKEMDPFLNPFREIQPGFALKDGTKLSHTIISHEYQNDYTLGIVIFYSNTKFDFDLGIITNAKRQGFYSKIEMMKK